MRYPAPFARGSQPPNVNVAARMRPLGASRAAAAAAAPPFWFLEQFVGTGDLSTHKPEIGGAYLNDSGSGALTDAKLDGAGGLPSMPHPVEPISAVIIGGPIYAFLIQFDVTSIAGGGNNLAIGMSGVQVATDNYAIDGALTYDGAVWRVAGDISDDGGTTLWSHSRTVDAVGLGSHVLAYATSPAGTLWALDDAVVLESAFTPQTAPDRFAFENFNMSGGSDGTSAVLRLAYGI
jgi:hypothetical protein